jgi:hypothetical protein
MDPSSQTKAPSQCWHPGCQGDRKIPGSKVDFTEGLASNGGDDVLIVPVLSHGKIGCGGCCCLAELWLQEMVRCVG